MVAAPIFRLHRFRAAVLGMGSGILLPHAVGSHGVLSGVFFHRFRIGTAPGEGQESGR